MLSRLYLVCAHRCLHSTHIFASLVNAPRFSHSISKRLLIAPHNGTVENVLPLQGTLLCMSTPNHLIPRPPETQSPKGHPGWVVQVHSQPGNPWVWSDAGRGGRCLCQAPWGQIPLLGGSPAQAWMGSKLWREAGCQCQLKSLKTILCSGWHCC